MQHRWFDANSANTFCTFFLTSMLSKLRESGSGTAKTMDLDVEFFTQMLRARLAGVIWRVVYEPQFV